MPPLWVSQAEPGSVHDLTAARIGICIPVKQPADGRDLDINKHVTASPSRIGDIACAALVLTHFENGYIE